MSANEFLAKLKQDLKDSNYKVASSYRHLNDSMCVFIAYNRQLPFRYLVTRVKKEKVTLSEFNDEISISTYTCDTDKLGDFLIRDSILKQLINRSS